MPKIVGSAVPGLEKSRTLVRFDVFELDLRAGELRRAGSGPMRLSEQPLRILMALVEHSGEVVLREEIRKALWPNDTIVEFEHSINAAMKRLRQALGDSAENPRYIETLARRGYRWMVPVQWVDAAPARASLRAGAAGGGESFTSNLIGKKVSHYRVLEIVGGGGMGVVYKAEDLKLGRQVALKFLPDELTGDPIALKRFEQEARAASALNHPHICTIYEVEEHEGQPFLVMELLEGETVRELISAAAPGKPPLELRKLLDLASQITEGLDAAHHQGIIHRDIKPANIFVTAHGQAKILDFGLAKLAVDPALSEVRLRGDHRIGDTQRTPGETAAAGVEPLLSRTGVTMGTAAYMSPEQVRGEKLDARTDLFSFGLVLYEVGTGRRAFAGDTTSELREAILKRKAIPARELNPELPREFEEIVNRALEKDREGRYQSASEMRADLKRLNELGRSATTAVSAPSAIRRAPARRRWPLFALGAAVFVTLALITVNFYVRRRQASRLTEKDTIVLAEFANSTGDAIFDDALKPALHTALHQSPFLNILPDNTVGAVLKRMTRPTNTPLTPEIARQVCQRAGSKAYVSGAIAALGSEYVLGLKAVNCETGEILARKVVTAEGKDEVLGALSKAAARLRAELGESLITVGKFDIPLDQTTPSLEALKAYNLGMKAADDKGPAAQLPHDLRAIELDPNFSMAYLAAAEDYLEMNQNGRATEYFTKAFQLRDHANEREKLEISSMYYYSVTGELDRAAQTFEKTIDSYPRSPAPYGNLSITYAMRGEYEKAVELARQVLTVSPSFGGEAYEGLAQNLLSLQRFDEARQTLEAAMDRKLETDGVHKELYGLAFLTGDFKGIAEQSAWFESKDEYENLGLSLESDTEAYAGHLRKSRELTRRAVESALRADSKEAAGMWLDNAALREELFGNSAEVRQAAAEALNTAPASQPVEIQAALALAMAGDTIRADSLAQDLNKRFPLHTQLQSLWLPTIEAQLALVRKKPAAAIARLRAAAPMEFGYVPFVSNVSCLYAVYLRGAAYLARGEGSAAAMEFQKIPDHSGIVWNCPTGALAHLGLARANALEARTAQGVAADVARTRALAAYRDFFELWKDADTDIPILRQANDEYARLK